MTYKQFYKELRKLKGAYQIELGSNSIRSCIPGIGYCPIVGVSLKTGGPDGYDPGGRYIGLSKKMITTIVDAADYKINSRAKKRVRAELLKTLGLKELR